jgi:hypothetical protein
MRLVGILLGTAMLSEERCAADFDLGKPKGAFAVGGQGQCNAMGVLRLETDRGMFAVKRNTSPPNPIALKVERAAVAAGIALPRPIETIAGMPVATYSSEAGELWVRVYPWVEGEPGEWGEVSEESSFAVGRLMAQIHGLSVADTDLDEPRWVPPGTSGWNALVRNAIAQKRSWAALLEEKVPFLVDAERYLERAVSQKRSPSQRDYHPPNVIKSPHGGRVLIDWDGAGPAFARNEALRYAMIWATPRAEGPIPQLVRSFLRGYRAVGGDVERPSLDEIVELAQPQVWWIWFNVRRELNDEPTPIAGLAAVLLSGVTAISMDEMERRRALFE